MYKLLIDIGNSGIKTGISSGKRVFSVKKFDYNPDNFINDFKKVLTYKKTDINKIGISCLNKNYH